MINETQVGTLRDSVSAALGVTGSTRGSVALDAGASEAVDDAVASLSTGSPGAADLVTSGDATDPLGAVVGAADFVGTAGVLAVEADGVFTSVGVDGVVGGVVPLPVGFGLDVGLLLPVGPGDGVVEVGAGSLFTGAATAGGRRVLPCCQARATAPPSGTSSPVTPIDE